MICKMAKAGELSAGVQYVPGTCANPECGETVYESLSLLDDTYAIWWGKCPYCGIINALDLRKSIRGYSSQRMDLCLPTEEEVIMNDILPPDTLTRGWEDPGNKGKSKEELIGIYR